MQDGAIPLCSARSAMLAYSSVSSIRFQRNARTATLDREHGRGLDEIAAERLESAA